ncbi:hypothetical protein NQ314_017718 [Rhamnusium bicolor]|uniref:Nucleotidyl transferase domain-containing protein n=1 Tax=Rhamnusium bicolor TaxID=1586634 RepID=A0AAV8WT08_9CUCU|nr:hypothetical protein NQ314_017718 [Rhamnusium bicolor]
MLKAIILIGGPQKRPLSLDIPKPLFPVAGLPLIQHHIEACAGLENLREILLIGFYPIAQIEQFVTDMQNKYSITIKYLQEFVALGTAGGLYHFRDQIRYGNPDAFFVMNGDVCADFPLIELYNFHKKTAKSLVTIMITEATKQQSLHYGCIVTNKKTYEVTHYVEKPSSYVSTLINCGIYVFSVDIFQVIGEAFNAKQQDYYSILPVCFGYIRLEQEVLAPLAGSGKMFALQVNNWWSQLKTAGSAIYANRHYLELYRLKHPERLYTSSGEGGCTVIPDVYIDRTASVHPTAVLGPNVSIGPGVTVGPGVRIKESIILADACIEERSLVLHSIIGRGSRVGRWARVEGTPTDPDPNKPFAKIENQPLFNNDGKLNPSITILGMNNRLCPITTPDNTGLQHKTYKV